MPLSFPIQLQIFTGLNGLKVGGPRNLVPANFIPIAPCRERDLQSIAAPLYGRFIVEPTVDIRMDLPNYPQVAPLTWGPHADVVNPLPWGGIPIACVVVLVVDSYPGQPNAYRNVYVQLHDAAGGTAFLPPMA
jgi:hypothetical protein